MKLQIGKALLAAAAVTAFAMLPSCGLYRATADSVLGFLLWIFGYYTP